MGLQNKSDCAIICGILDAERKYFAMATLLLVVIYAAFIGLGVPDAVFGSVWPAVYEDFGISVSMAPAVTMTCTCGSIIMSFFSARIINRFGTPAVTTVCTCLTAMALLGFSFAPNIWWMALLALPLGLGGGCIDAALNNYVAVHYKASHMSFLHCFYGVGVALSPYIMSLALGNSGDWRKGYRTVFIVQACIALITIVSLPLWKKAHGSERKSLEKESGQAAISPFVMLKDPKMRLTCLVFFGSCALEMGCCAYGSTYLVKARGMAADLAAMMISVNYAGQAVGRFTSGLLAKKYPAQNIIAIGQIILLPAILLLILPLKGTIPAAVAMFLIGFGNGPVFPNMVHITPENFENSQSAMGVQMSAGYIGVLVSPIICGALAKIMDFKLFGWYLLVLFLLFSAGICLLGKYSKKNK